MEITKESIEKARTYAYARVLSYAKIMWPGYRVGKHHAVIAAHLQAIEKGLINRLIITMPPRHGKTMLASEFFTAWYMGRNPEDEIIFTTYSQERSSDVGKKVRNQLIDPEFQAIFPKCQISSDSKSTSRIGTEAGGSFFAVGIGGAITGRGANCLSGETLIATDTGQIAIKDLFSSDSQHTVLCYDHESGIVTSEKIVAKKRSFANELVEITTSNGDKIRCTLEHLIYTFEGYKPAGLCNPGDGVFFRSSKISSDAKPLCHLQERQSRKERPFLQRVLCQNSKSSSCFKMFCLWRIIRKTSLRIRKIITKGTQRLLLFARMFTGTPCYQKSTQMRNLWQTKSKENDEILFGQMSGKEQSTISKINRHRMSNLWRNLLSKIIEDSVLFSKMCEFCSFFKNVWERKFQLHPWTQIHQTVLCYEGIGSDKRLGTMRSLRDSRANHRSETKKWKLSEIESSRTSYRFESKKRYADKSGNNVYSLSHCSSQVKRTTISMVKRIRTKSHPVYDLQIEPHHNFFANGILVHNCLILDDVIKGQEEAESELARSKMKDWYQTTAYPRLMPKNAVIVINTRWHLDDLTGWLLREHPDENWYLLSLPAIAEKDDPEITERKEGDALWPEAYPVKRLNQIKMAIGTRAWNALYQQNPTGKKGTIIQYDWLKHYENPPKKFKRIIQSWDTAFKAKQINDPSCCLTFGETRNAYYLLDAFVKRMEYPELKKQVKRLHREWKANAVICEDKGSGQSLIQDIKNETQIPIIGIEPESDKETRMSTQSGTVEAGKLWLPSDAPWLIDYESELISFPFAPHDDQVDATSQFLKYANGPRYKHSRKNRYWK